MPSWAISQIEYAIYGFFSKNKHPLVNRDILALPLREGGFNIPQLETKIQAFRLNSLRRLLTKEDAHWTHFTAYFTRKNLIFCNLNNLCMRILRLKDMAYVVAMLMAFWKKM